MTPDFSHLQYLNAGSARQQLAYRELTELGLMETLASYAPLLAGTIPLGIDVPESDLDIICQCTNHTDFAQQLQVSFGTFPNFTCYQRTIRSIPSTIARFQGQHFLIEIFGQNTPSHRQVAYRHMLVEYRLLQERGPAFARQVRTLKAQGIKTEPAFAQLLGLAGDPYEALLSLE